MPHTAEPPGWISQFRELVMDVAADFSDLRADDPRWRPSLDLNDYGPAQAVAAALRAAGSDRLVYRSVRDPAAQCADVFYSDRTGNVVQARHVDYRCNGTSVDLCRNADSGEVFLVG